MHLTQRVAWHDSRWNGRVCRAPSGNPYCIALPEVHRQRKDELEDTMAEQSWDRIGGKGNPYFPPCARESGAFMSERPWQREFEHPYANVRETNSTHGQLLPTLVPVPAHSTFAVPYNWMLLSEQKKLDARLAQQLPPDEDGPFERPTWVFGRARQEAILESFFSNLRAQRSLVFFYTKDGNPLGDSVNRLVVGVGEITSIAQSVQFDSAGAQSYTMWDRLFSHSIRVSEPDGLLLPYHDYIEPTGDPDEDDRRLELLRGIAVIPDPTHVRSFSYVSELASADVALATLTQCLKAVRQVREDKVASGPWSLREEWLNAQIATAWKDRGAYPGLGSALEAIGLRLGTALTLELAEVVAFSDSPWEYVDAVLRGQIDPPSAAYASDIDAVRPTWAALKDERRSLLELLARFDLSPSKAKDWFDPNRRSKTIDVAISDSQLLANPFRIAELDVDSTDERAVSIGMLDRGLFPESTIAAKHPLPEPSRVSSPMDWRRVRAGLVTVLRKAAEEGDALLAAGEALERVGHLDLPHRLEVGVDWLAGHSEELADVIDTFEVGPDDNGLDVLQLTEFFDREQELAKILKARADKKLQSLEAPWARLISEAVEAAGHRVDPTDERHQRALVEQEHALETVTTRKLSVLVGRAGTGKTSVIGALLGDDVLRSGGVLLLAPTGKARVKLEKAAGGAAQTVAQFLHGLKRYDGQRQRVLFSGDVHSKERTLVIDECSMLTLDQLYALFQSLDLGHVQRIILVGDPNQLPPIGVGRPFADLVDFLEGASGDLAGAIARLSVELRTVENEDSDALRLAAAFTRGTPTVATDRIFVERDEGKSFNDLEIAFWTTPDELYERLGEQMQRHLNLASPQDVVGFDRALGLGADRLVPYDNPDGAESFQILSPVRMRPHGVHELNRWVQRRFRANEVEAGAKHWTMALGEEGIVVHDKVILIRNGMRDGWNHELSARHDGYLANGEVGVVAQESEPWLNVAFANRPWLRFGFHGREFPSSGGGPLQLAYALTVHKAQGSEFGTVFMVLPKEGRLLSRELLYTALTRASQRLVLLVEGTNAASLYDYTQPERSETERRNTNLFRATVRAADEYVPYAKGLIHTTRKGHKVRSKSELQITTVLSEHKLAAKYDYERPYVGTQRPGTVRPDFSFTDPSGETIIWEHLGMLGDPTYDAAWTWKRKWYLDNGFVEGETLFTTCDDDRGALDVNDIDRTAELIERLL